MDMRLDGFAKEIVLKRTCKRVMKAYLPDSLTLSSLSKLSMLRFTSSSLFISGFFLKMKKKRAVFFKKDNLTKSLFSGKKNTTATFDEW
jgi:hypothetical protein